MTNFRQRAYIIRPVSVEKLLVLLQMQFNGKAAIDEVSHTYSSKGRNFSFITADGLKINFNCPANLSEEEIVEYAEEAYEAHKRQEELGRASLYLIRR